MASNINFLSRATDCIHKAVQKDTAEEYRDALNLYSSGIQYLLTALKYEKNQKIVDVIKNKAVTYLKRAEEIKDMLDKPQPRHYIRRGNSVTLEQKENDAYSANSDDEETNKLQNTLSNAIVIHKPNVKWSDVAGLETAKGLLKEAVILPIRFPQLFRGKRKPNQGILLYGPPGTGKSFLAKAVAHEANQSTFFSVSSSDLISKYVGESEKLIKNLFILARRKKPSIIFIDEIDSLATKRGDNDSDSTRRVKTELLVQMNGVGKDCSGVLVLGATNCPWDLDPAVRRRFAKRVYIPLPGTIARKTMFNIHAGSETILTDKEYGVLANKTEGFSGSDISAIVQDALMEPVRTLQSATHFKKEYKDDGDYKWMPCSSGDPQGTQMNLMDFAQEEDSKISTETLKLSHFLRVLQNANPSVGHEDIENHIAWTNKFGQEGV